jgi:predicted Fe-Mo cluster-binding NifX family protein
VKSLICAFGTDDGKHFTNRHFGDSNKFDLYEISNESISFIKQIENNSVEETTHADPKKAGSISKILKTQGVQIVVSKQFGPNIKRIRKNFVCIRVLEDDIAPIQKMTIDNIEMINQMWENGEERGFITQVDNHFKIIK